MTKRLFIFVFLLHLMAPAFPQSTRLNATLPAAQAPEAVSENRPDEIRRQFKIQPLTLTGEKLTYEVKFSRFLINASVGEVTFEFIGRTPTPLPESLIQDLNAEFTPGAEEPLIHLRASAFSKGILTKLFGITARDRFESLVNADDFRARLSFRRIQEGKRNYAQAEIFDHKEPAAVIHQTHTDFTKENAVTRKEAKPDWLTLDLLGAFYFIRFLELKTGETLTIPVNDEAQQYRFDTYIGAREKISTSLGKFNAVRVEPQLFGNGRFFGRSGEMILWLTDDERHLPVRLMAKTSSGTVTATLIKVSLQNAQARKK
jgi:hypothetical protein